MDLTAVIDQLLQPDSEVIKQATAQLKGALQDPACVPELCKIIGTAPNPQHRQYAAVILRRMVAAKSRWESLQPEVKNGLKESVLPVLLQESIVSVRRSVCQLVTSMAELEHPDPGWPQLLAFLQQHITSSHVPHREVGLLLLSSLTVGSGVMSQHTADILSLCGAALDPSCASLDVTSCAIQSLTNVVAFVGSTEKAQFQALVPKVVAAIRHLATTDQDKAISAMEIFDELLDSEVPIMQPMVKDLILFCLEIAETDSLEGSLRVKAISLIDLIASEKKKSLVKLKLLGRVLNTLMSVMCKQPDDDDDDDDDEDEETPTKAACSLLDSMALNLPASALVPPLLSLVDACLASPEASKLRAAFLAAGYICEGCADYIITKKHLGRLVRAVCGGMTHDNPGVRHAALFAVGQFAQFLQPDVVKVSGDILGLVFGRLEALPLASGDARTSREVSRLFFTIEIVAENMESEIEPYVDRLMTGCLAILETGPKPRLQGLALKCIAATAQSAKARMSPYIPALLGHVKGHLTSLPEQQDLQTLQTDAIDTLGVVIRAVGEQHFPAALCAECSELLVQLLQQATQPDLRKSLYGLFVGVTSVLKEHTAPTHVEIVTAAMLKAATSEEGFTAHYSGQEEAAVADLFAELGADAETTDTGVIQGVSVENAYLEEKEDASYALGQIAVNCGPVFSSYVGPALEAAFANVDHPAEDVRRAATSGTAHLCASLALTYKSSGSPESKQAFEEALGTILPKLLHAVEHDVDRVICMSTLESVKDLLEQVKATGLVSLETAARIADAVANVLAKKTACQRAGGDDDDDDEEEEVAEFDAMVLEYAGDVIPALCAATGASFVPRLTPLLALISKKLKGEVAERSFATGVLAETAQELGPHIAPLASQIMQVLRQNWRDEDGEVRTNSIYGAGVLCLHCSSTFSAQIPQILNELVQQLQVEDERNVVDNIAGAVCRILMGDSNAVPLQQVLPVLLELLPMQEDEQEQNTAVNCLAQLHTANPAAMVPYMPRLLVVLLKTAAASLEDACRSVLEELLQSLHMQHQPEFSAAAASLPPDLRDVLESAPGLSNGHP